MIAAAGTLSLSDIFRITLGIPYNSDPTGNISATESFRWAVLAYTARQGYSWRIYGLGVSADNEVWDVLGKLKTQQLIVSYCSY